MLRTFFMEAMQAQCFLKLDWLISVVSITNRQTFPLIEEVDLSSLPKYTIVCSKETNKVYYSSPDSPSLSVLLPECKLGDAVMVSNSPITVEKGELPNLTSKVDTTYGTVLFNAMILCWPFGSKIPFQNGNLKGRAIDNLIAPLVVDTLAPGETPQPDLIYVPELIRYKKAVSNLVALGQIITPAASVKTMTIAPEIIKRRDELLIQYKDKLDDPATIALIMKELSQMDRDWHKGDSSEKFYIVPKLYDVARMKMFIMYGLEAGFTPGNPTLITKSLEEGIDMHHFPAIVDGLRSGSYFRGKMTALGGESVKYFNRTFQNTTIVTPDCGSIGGLKWIVTKAGMSKLLGQYQVVNKKPVLLTEENLKAQMEQVITVRSFQFCKTPYPGVCGTCAGTALARRPKGINMAQSGLGSVMMYVMMKAMHGRALTTARYNFRTAIT